MPNIEIHGFGDGREIKAGAYVLRKRILERTADLAFAGNMVVTLCNTECLDRKDKKQPFIRIFSTKQEELNILVERLAGLADIEVMPSTMKFIPKG